MDSAALLINAMLIAATPLVFAAIGELVAERAGVLNLGVEGMMLIGAVCGFVVAVSTGSSVLAVLAAAGAGAVVSLLFAVLTLSLLANQVATGLALTIFGVGLSALLGRDLIGRSLPRLGQLDLPGITEIPLIGPVLFGQDALVYLSVAAVALVHWFIHRTRPGLVLRAVGESHDAAHALGYPVIRVRYFAVLFGGAMAGIGGAYLSLASTPMWAENMTAGRGWIALALVVFATWRPWRVLVGAYLFGGVAILQLRAQGLGWHIPAPFMSMLPYLATILVLVLISAGRTRARLNAPAALGKVFHPES